jgi:arabinogalactan oligomer/maltooligosaccharide transport system permease protein
METMKNDSNNPSKNDVSFVEKYAKPVGSYILRKVLPKLLVYLYMTIVVIIILVPVFWMVTSTFYNSTLLSSIPLIPKPSRWTLAKYVWLFTYKRSLTETLPDFVKAFLLSLSIATLTMVGTVILSTINGFAFSRFKFKGKKAILLTMMLLQMFPSFMSMMAYFLVFRSLGWNNSLNGMFGLVLIYMTGSIPINIFIVRGYLRGIPKSIDEAAYIDGASKPQLFFKIIFPLSVPIIGFVAVNAFMSPWLDYLLQGKLMGNNYITIATWLWRINDILAPKTYDPIAFMAGALLIAIPIVIVNFAMQKYIVYGMATGAEKG